MNRFPDHFTEEDSLPPALHAAMQQRFPTPAVPPSVDRAITQQAWAYFSAQRRVRRWLRVGGAAAAAVALVFAVRVGFYSQPAALPILNTPAIAQSFAAEDIDRNGAIDILDAFAVARGIKAHSTFPAWDVNEDGVVDEKDVDQIARLAVRGKGSLR